MPLKKRSAPTTNDSIVSTCWLEDALEDGSSLLSGNMPAAPTATFSFDSMSRHEDGLDNMRASGRKQTMHSPRRRRVSSGSFSCQERVLQDKQNNDTKCPLFSPIVALVDEMICVKKDHDKAETKELCSKLSEIIREMQDDVESVPRNANRIR